MQNHSSTKDIKLSCKIRQDKQILNLPMATKSMPPHEASLKPLISLQINSSSLPQITSSNIQENCF